MAKRQKRYRNGISDRKLKPAPSVNFWRRRKVALMVNHGWQIALSRCRGNSHFSNYTPCQDQVFKAELQDGTRVIVLADGAGSAKFSHFGAALVVRRAASLVGGQFDQVFSAAKGLEHVGRWLIANLVIDLNTLAKKGVPADTCDRTRLQLPNKTETPLVQCTLQDLSSTLLLVAVKDNRYIAAHLGDGVIGVEELGINEKRQVRVLSTPDNGEFANVTQFVTSGSAIDSIRVYRGQLDAATKFITGFILMSDGSEASLYRKATKTLAPGCNKLLQACRNLPKNTIQVQLTATLHNVITAKTNDDCSIALLAR